MSSGRQPAVVVYPVAIVAIPTACRAGCYRTLRHPAGIHAGTATGHPPGIDACGSQPVRGRRGQRLRTGPAPSPSRPRQATRSAATPMGPMPSSTPNQPHRTGSLRSETAGTSARRSPGTPKQMSMFDYLGTVRADVNLARDERGSGLVRDWSADLSTTTRPGHRAGMRISGGLSPGSTDAPTRRPSTIHRINHQSPLDAPGDHL